MKLTIAVTAIAAVIRFVTPGAGTYYLYSVDPRTNMATIESEWNNRTQAPSEVLYPKALSSLPMVEMSKGL